MRRVQQIGKTTNYRSNYLALSILNLPNLLPPNVEPASINPVSMAWTIQELEGNIKQVVLQSLRQLFLT